MLILTGCGVNGKAYSPFPKLTFFENFQNDKGYILTADETLESRFLWWEQYEDPALNLLISKMLDNNLDLKIAGERILQSQENIKISQSNLFPSLSLGSSVNRQATPANTGGFNIPNQTDTFYNTNYDLGIDAQWQIDLFGEIRNGINARTANYLSVQANRDALIQTLITQMIELRTSLGNLNARQDIIRKTIASRAKTLETINRRYELGVSSVDALQVRLARENLESAKSQLPPLESAIKETKYAIDLLIGEMPDETNDYNDVALSLLPPPNKLSLPPPVKMLDSRPDLRVQNYRLLAANNDIDVALAALYPSLSLSGGYGFQSRELGNLIDVETIAWNLLANVTQPLFEGGRIRANIRLQESEARELAVEYTKSILTAVNEVENALQNEENLFKQFDALTKTNDEAKHAYKLSQTRYEKGLIPLTDLLDIERRTLAQDLQILEIQQAIWQARLNLYIATGGDWLDEDGRYDPQLPEIEQETLDRV